MSSLPKAHVLLVEDDEDTREVLRMIMESDGIEVAVARDGLDALTRIEQLRLQDPRAPSVIVLDYMMPRCSGPQFRQRQLASDRGCAGHPRLGDLRPAITRRAPQAVCGTAEARRSR
jgi:CheY-like chemotaxis protein